MRNTIGPNCEREGRHEITIAENLHNITIAGNAITMRGAAGGQALSVAAGCTGVAFVDNTICGRAQSTGDIAGRDDLVSMQVPDTFPMVGPTAAGPQSVAHLNLPSVRPLQ